MKPVSQASKPLVIVPSRWKNCQARFEAIGPFFEAVWPALNPSDCFKMGQVLICNISYIHVVLLERASFPNT